MSFWIIRRIFGICILLFSVVLIFWGIRPLPTNARSIQLLNQELQLQGDLTGFNAPAGELVLEAPETLRLGDPAQIQLTYKPLLNAQANNPLNRSDAFPLAADDDGYIKVFIAQMDLAAVRHTPAGEISQALSNDHPVVFLWNLRPGLPGNFDGKIWLYLRHVPEGGGDEIRKLVAVQSLEIRVVDLLSLNGMEVRLAGTLTGIFGIFLGFEDIISKRIMHLFNRGGRQSSV